TPASSHVQLVGARDWVLHTGRCVSFHAAALSVCVDGRTVTGAHVRRSFRLEARGGRVPVIGPARHKATIRATVAVTSATAASTATQKIQASFRSMRGPYASS